MNYLTSLTNSLLQVDIQKIWEFMPVVLSNIQVKDIFDIVVVAFFIYLIFLFIKQTRSFSVLFGTFLLFILYYLSVVFNLVLTRQFFQQIVTFLLVIFIIVFQREIRRFFQWSFASRGPIYNQLRLEQTSTEISEPIVTVAMEMAHKRIGAIMVLTGDYPLGDLMEGGFALDGMVSVPILLSIFDSNSPGHDGAVILEDGLIKRYGVHLPLAENFKGITKVGTRHRAAAGITERTDALAIVVSEERGEVSIMEDGQMTVINDRDKLFEIVKKFLKENIDEPKSFWSYFFAKNFLEKVFAILLAIVLWFSFAFQTGVVNQDFSIPVEYQFLSNNYVISDTSTKEIKVTLAGSNKDFNTATDESVKVVVDLKDRTDGTYKIPIGEENILHPSYFNFVDVNPKYVWVTVKNSQ